MNFLADFIVQNFGFDQFEVDNYAMSARSLMNDSRAPIWQGEKFDAFMKSNADVFIIMIGTNDDMERWHLKGKILLWNDTNSIDQFVKTYVDLGNKIKALPQKPELFIVIPPPIAERCFTKENNVLVEVDKGCDLKKNLTMKSKPLVYK